MRPQLFAADHITASAFGIIYNAGFNEAAAIRCGSPAGMRPKPRSDEASMRPQLFAADHERITIQQRGLQDASMRPQLFAADHDWITAPR